MTAPLTAEIDRLRAENAELRAALQGVIRAYDKPHYGDYEAQSDNVFVAVEIARKVQP